MKWKVLILFPFVIACKVVMNNNYPTISRPLKLQIVLLIDDKFSYQIKLLNRSSDTIEIVKPELDQGYAYFFKLKKDSSISHERCFNYSINKIEWLELIPMREVTITGRMTLKDLFCTIDENDNIGYNYYGAYRRKGQGENTFSFEIMPDKIGKLDSVVMEKTLFK